MPPPHTHTHTTQIESVSMLTKIIISSLLCHNDTKYNEWLKSINYFKEHNFGQNLKLQSAVVTFLWSVQKITHRNFFFDISKCQCDLEKWPKSNQLFKPSQQCTGIYASLVKNHPNVQKITHGNQATWTLTQQPTGYAPKTICPPPFRQWGLNEFFTLYKHLICCQSL